MSNSQTSPDQLRTQAEAKLALAAPPIERSQSVENLLHELQVHKIQLEMQNEALLRTQVELEVARDRYVDLYEFAPVGYVTLSRTAQITSINLTGATLLGIDRKNLLQRRFSGFVAPEDHDHWQHYFTQAMSLHEKQTCELTLRRSNGTSVNLQLDSLLISDSNANTELRIALTDITERKRMDHVLQDNNADLARARAVADKANLAKSDFLSGMSHELRSPLNAMLGFAQLLESGNPLPTQSQKDRIEQIIKAGWYLLGLINEILDLAMIESGKQPMTLESLSLSEVLLDCQAMIEPMAKKSGITLNFPKFEHPCFVYADRTRLKQIMLNLLSNAIKYNRAGGSVVVTFNTNTAERIYIAVEDTGDGLSRDKLRHLFQPFNRLGQQSGTAEGSGIGLVLTKRLVELMGGRIGVESVVDRGSVFWIELHITEGVPETVHKDILPAPIHTVVKAAVEAAAVEAAAAQKVSAIVAPRTVLYVEDNPANMMLVEQILERRTGIRLLKAGNGASGIALARLHLPDVILMDINLPGISGIQALHILHDDPATAHIPVLAISANAMPLDVQRGLEAGFMKYITKPIKVNEFLEALNEALDFAKGRP